MFTWFDTLIFTIITTSTMFGAYKGIMKLVISTLGFISSIIVTYYLYPYVSETITEHFSNYIFLTMISGVSSYIFSLIVCSLLTNKFLLMIAIITGGAIDRFFGLIAGAIRGVIICLLLFTTIAIIFSDSYLEAKTLEDVVKNATVDKYPTWLQNSSSTPYLNSLSDNLVNSLSPQFLQSVQLPKTKLNTLEKSLYKTNNLDTNTNLSPDLEEGLNEILTEKVSDND
ncbi:MAG: CvpA family protein [Rickettsia endosymbiont of Bryobia graminum]|nr:CvpA family protein [Rickettsia endosymbiont of Bryobia graminum]